LLPTPSHARMMHKLLLPALPQPWGAGVAFGAPQRALPLQGTWGRGCNAQTERNLEC
uniref:Uncharacterized protein n=1 Tax=Geospiza parvula TaxID=87175 RepID=A0A8C3NNT7_GEOPR